MAEAVDQLFVSFGLDTSDFVAALEEVDTLVKQTAEALSHTKFSINIDVDDAIDTLSALNDLINELGDKKVKITAESSLNIAEQPAVNNVLSNEQEQTASSVLTGQGELLGDNLTEQTTQDGLLSKMDEMLSLIKPFFEVAAPNNKANKKALSQLAQQGKTEIDSQDERDNKLAGQMAKGVGDFVTKAIGPLLTAFSISSIINTGKTAINAMELSRLTGIDLQKAQLQARVGLSFGVNENEHYGTLGAIQQRINDIKYGRDSRVEGIILEAFAGQNTGFNAGEVLAGIKNGKYDASKLYDMIGKAVENLKKSKAGERGANNFLDMIGRDLGFNQQQRNMLLQYEKWDKLERAIDRNTLYTEQDIKAMEQYRSDWGELGRALEELKVSVIRALVPVLTPIIKVLTSFFTWISKSNQASVALASTPAMVTIGTIAGASLAGTAAGGPLGGLIAGLSAVLSAIILRYWDDIKQFFEPFLDGLTVVGDKISNFLSKIGEYVSRIWEKIFGDNKDTKAPDAKPGSVNPDSGVKLGANKIADGSKPIVPLGADVFRFITPSSANQKANNGEILTPLNRIIKGLDNIETTIKNKDSKNSWVGVSNDTPLKVFTTH